PTRLFFHCCFRNCINPFHNSVTNLQHNGLNFALNTIKRMQSFISCKATAMKNLFVIAALLISAKMYAQHEHHMPVKEESGQMKTTNDTTPPHQHHSMQPEHDMGNMSHAFSLNLPMSRNGSGTGWLPDASPMYGAMYH